MHDFTPALQPRTETLTGHQPAWPAPEAVQWYAAMPDSRTRFLNALNRTPVDRPPFWFMRQAGRCLPEYRALKEKYTFHDLINSPELAMEVTLQPVRRFQMDAAILFSDILVVPEAMGQAFSFRETGGVHMEFRLTNRKEIEALDASGLREKLSYVGATLQSIRKELRGQTALIGFAGSPWTLANFMLEGGSSKDFKKAYELFKNDRESFDLLLDKLSNAVADFLKFQIENGADVVQIFDTLGGNLPTEEFEAASGRWMRKIVKALNHAAPSIVFAKGCHDWVTLRNIGSDGVGVGHEFNLADAAKQLPNLTVQGNFDPELLVTATPKQIESEATKLLNSMRRRDGYIFNLGHGVPPETKMENLETLVATIKNFA
jgi:uroporphyrinogen decarboxylase